MADKSNNGFRRLRKRVERALAGGERGTDVFRDLETIVRQAADGDRDALFAHRQLAELRLEDSPWRAALHLRKLILADAADDGVFALMGLCQAMLGNFRSAISAYQRAIELAPRNPWYHHNLGHLLDVGLGNARAALRHLHLAHELEDKEDEITASLAHCMARLGQFPEARTLAAEALRGAPSNRDHRALLDWIERGAPGARFSQQASKQGRVRGVQVQGRGGPQGRGELRPTQATQSSARRSSGQSTGRTGVRVERVDRVANRDPVARLLASAMPQAGFSPEHVHRAQALWDDFHGRRAPRVAKPAVYAAAIEYAIAKVHNVRGVTQAELGHRYGVAPATISSRYAEIRSALALVPGDPRYSAAR
jgi:tetratricopeptide (TPR) repeat protein